jgi:hypothetical protein
MRLFNYRFGISDNGTLPVGKSIDLIGLIEIIEEASEIGR